MTCFHNNSGKVFEEDLFKAPSGNVAGIYLLYPLFQMATYINSTYKYISININSKFFQNKFLKKSLHEEHSMMLKFVDYLFQEKQHWFQDSSSFNSAYCK